MKEANILNQCSTSYDVNTILNGYMKLEEQYTDSRNETV